MGVRGLTSFFDSNPQLSKSFLLHDTKVIVDGNNLIHRLYFSNKIDCIYGGDYNRYAKNIRKYLGRFLQCNIKPIIIFDGGYEKSDKKFNTCKERYFKRLALTNHISKYGECIGSVYPVNAQEVFRNILLEMNISFVQCDFEADDQITALANYYDCPVLSDDSDFYIFDIPKGFIRISSIISEVCTDNRLEVPIKYLKCNIYCIDNFLSFFPKINRTVLPLLSTLLGNDYVNTKDFQKFFSSVNLPKRKHRGLNVNQNHRRIVRLISWLEERDLKISVALILNNLKEKNRDYVRSIIEKSIEGYSLQKCHLSYLLDGDISELKRLLPSNSKILTCCGELLPIPFIIAFNQGLLPPFFLNVITLHRILLLPQVENCSLESSYVCSVYIRQVIYGILLQHHTSNLEQHQQQCNHDIEEYDRQRASAARKLIKPLYHLKNGSVVLKLDDLYEKDKNYLLEFFLQFLDISLSYFSSIPNDLHLLLASVNFWLRNCNPCSREEYVYAIALNVIYFYIVKQRHILEGKEGGINILDEVSINDISIVMKCVSIEEIEFSKKGLKKYLCNPTLNRGNPLLIDITHSFGQLQTCILYLTYLNMLLNFPFECIKLYNTLSGTMIYNLSKDLMSRKDKDLFVAELLGRKSKLTILFNLIKDKLFELVPFECIDRSEILNKKIKKKKKVKETPTDICIEQDSIADINGITNDVNDVFI